MPFDTRSLPAPPMLQQAIVVKFNYGDKDSEIGCIALAIHNILEIPHFNAIDCIYASVIHDRTSGNLFETILWLVPLQYVTNISMGFTEIGMEFQSPTKMLCVFPDKPAPKNRMQENRIRARLSEFGVSL